jgi:RNA polymerase sigma-70 factor (ECF subfamily)
MVTEKLSGSPITVEQVQLAQKGDEAAIRELYLRHRTGVFRYLFYQLGDTQTVEDLTSEVFLRMLRALPSYQLRGSFQAWLYQIAHNLLVDYYRKEKRHVGLPLQEDLLADGDDPSEAIDHQLTSQRLQAALAQLNQAQREVLVLRFVSGLPIDQVAQTLKTSEDAVKGLQYRALIALRHILKDWNEPYEPTGPNPTGIP